MPGLGTIINTAAIVVGGLLGLLFKNLLTKSMEDTLLKASSVCVLRRIGLSGKSIVPMLIGFGCTVPAVMATRTLPSERARCRLLRQ